MNTNRNFRVVPSFILCMFLLPSIGLASDGGSVASILGPIALGWVAAIAVGWNKPKIGVAIATLMGFGIAMT